MLLRLHHLPRHLPLLRSLTRLMSTNPWAEPLPSSLNYYLCTIPDLLNSTRLEIRAEHLERAKSGFERGWIVQGGATFEDDSKMKMVGSWLLMREENVGKAMKRLEQDVYATKGVWDLGKATITPVLAVGPK